MGKAYSQDLRERVMAAVDADGRLCCGILLPENVLSSLMKREQRQIWSGSMAGRPVVNAFSRLCPTAIG